MSREFQASPWYSAFPYGMSKPAGRAECDAIIQEDQSLIARLTREDLELLLS